MEFKEALARRRMVRNYRDEPVPLEVLGRIAASALRAPSAGNTQGISVVLVTDPDLRKRIADLAGEPEYVSSGFDPWVSRAPGHIVVSVSERHYHDRYQEPDKLDDSGAEIDWPVPYWWIDAGAALMAVLLAAVDEGLAAGFLGVHATPDLRRLLAIPEHFSPIGVVTVGRPERDRRSGSLARGKRPTSETLHHDLFGTPL